MNYLGWKLFNALFPRTLESFARRFALLPKIRRLIRDAENPRRQSDNAISKKYNLNGKNVGGFSFDENKVVIKLNSELITDDVAKKIYQMVADALANI